MSLKPNNEPPRWAIDFFQWFCHPRFREELEGDLRERFQKRSGQCTGRRNRLLFIKDLITLFRPQFIGNFHQLTFDNFSSVKRMLGRFPEYYLILLVFAIGYRPPLSVHAASLWLIAILVLQIILKNRIIWVLIACLFIALNFYMILALISEFSEFPTFNTRAKTLLFAATGVIFLNITMCGAVIARYTKEKGKHIITTLFLLTSGFYGMAFLAWSRRSPAYATSGILFYAGLGLIVFTFIAGVIAIHGLADKGMVENAPQRRPSVNR